VHDVFEAGTDLDANGRPTPCSRALPDGEIVTGTPIPAVVPMPVMAMAPLPERVQIKNGQAEVLGKGNPGYPFFVPGVAGHRAPHPPLDFAPDGDNGELDGGLPRHVVLGAAVTAAAHDHGFQRDLGTIAASSCRSKARMWRGRDGLLRSAATREFSPRQTRARAIVNGLPRGPQHAHRSPILVLTMTAGHWRRQDGSPASTKASICRSARCSARRIAPPAAAHDGLVGRRPALLKANRHLRRCSSAPTAATWWSIGTPAGAGYYELDDFQVRADRHSWPAHPPGEI
jgi:hypothetical protein